MKLQTSNKPPSRLKADLVACFAYEGDREPRGIEDDELREALAAEMKAEGFRGRPTDVVLWNSDGKRPSRRYLVVGLGKPGGTAGDAIRVGCARATRSGERIRARTLALRLPHDGTADAEAEVRGAVEGALLGAYRFDRYLTDPDRKPVRLTGIEVSTVSSPRVVRRAAALGQVVSRAVILARDLVNEPPSSMTPERVARRAREVAGESGLTARVLTDSELRRLGMRAMLAVGRGGKNPPRLVHLRYRPVDSRRPRGKIVLVGKGVTFDSGGLNLKPTGYIETMKCDMAGAAAVLGTMTALRDLGCKSEVHGLLGLVENMPGASAYKPGDILQTFSGKTVEVTNTDAEGRLVLADVLAWAAKTIAPDRMIDLATLTGACVIALGTQAVGLFSRDDELRDDLLDAGRRSGEKLWPMPMYEEYLEPMQKGPADLRNTGDRWGGAISAALFLGEFVPKSVPWAHLDIAGPSFLEKPIPEAAEGGTGAGVRTLLRWLEQAGK